MIFATTVKTCQWAGLFVVVFVVAHVVLVHPLWLPVVLHIEHYWSKICMECYTILYHDIGSFYSITISEFIRRLQCTFIIINTWEKETIPTYIDQRSSVLWPIERGSPLQIDQEPSNISLCI